MEKELIELLNQADALCRERIKGFSAWGGYPDKEQLVRARMLIQEAITELLLLGD